MTQSWACASVAECLSPVSVAGKTKIQSRDYKTSGRFPIIDQGQDPIAGWTDEEGAVISSPLPLVVFGDHTRAFKFVDKPFARGSDGTQLLLPKPNIDPLFFYYACRAIDLPARGYNRHFTVLKEKELSYPVSREEQTSIAKLLHQTESALFKQDDLLNTLLELKKATMRELFTRGLRGEAQKETEIGLVPQSWSVGKLIDFAHFQRGFDITKSEQKPGSVPVVSSGGIKSWHNVAGAKGPGVIIGRKGSIGSVYYVAEDYWPHDTTLWCTDFKGNLPLFVYYCVQLLDLKKLDSGATNPALNRNFLHDEPISWPQVETQKEIVEILQAIDNKIELHKQKRAVLDELFKSLLYKLMTGEIRMSELNLAAFSQNEVTV